jgi:hypothetical protein
MFINEKGTQLWLNLVMKSGYVKSAAKLHGKQTSFLIHLGLLEILK